MKTWPSWEAALAACLARPVTRTIVAVHPSQAMSLGFEHLWLPMPISRSSSPYSQCRQLSRVLFKQAV